MHIEEIERKAAVRLIEAAHKEAKQYSANPEDANAATYAVLLRALDTFAIEIGIPNWRRSDTRDSRVHRSDAGISDTAD